MKWVLTTRIKKRIPLLSVVLLLACVKDKNFDTLKNPCEQGLIANTTFLEVKNLYPNKVIQIQEDWIIEGYVISSDKAGNFFGTIHFQDRVTTPSSGFQIDVDLRDSHLFYEVGSKIFLKLKGLYLGKSKGTFKLGGTFTAFGNLSVGRLPAHTVYRHLFRSCDASTQIESETIEIEDLEDSMVNTLIQLSDVEIIEEDLGQSFALPKEETERTIVDCDGNEILLLNSGFSDFQKSILPAGNGSIRGVLHKDNTDYQLIIRDLKDIDFSNERCEEIVDEFTSNQIFISELADPDNNSGARFVELYNSNTEPLNLKGWALKRYTNDNSEENSIVDLSGFVIKAESTLIISPNATEFIAVYGFPPNISVGTNSPADSNGDDNLELVDPFGTVVDAFGIVGEDGSNTNHEFEDGRAVRNKDVNTASPSYTFAEWTIYNDSGNSGTINLPQNAPDDFTPGERD